MSITGHSVDSPITMGELIQHAIDGIDSSMNSGWMYTQEQLTKMLRQREYLQYQLDQLSQDQKDMPL
jgi:hypothetical protein